MFYVIQGFSTGAHRERSPGFDFQWQEKSIRQHFSCGERNSSEVIKGGLDYPSRTFERTVTKGYEPVKNATTPHSLPNSRGEFPCDFNFPSGDHFSVEPDQAMTYKGVGNC
jgi:hypothetical protein